MNNNPNISRLLNEAYLDLSGLPKKEWRTKLPISAMGNSHAGMALVYALKLYVSISDSMDPFVLLGHRVGNIEEFQLIVDKYMLQVEQELLTKLYTHSFMGKQSSASGHRATQIFNFLRLSLEEKLITLEIPQYLLDRNVLWLLKIHLDKIKMDSNL